MTNTEKPTFILIAGVNGAGKSTYYQSDTEVKNLTYINPDDIAKELSPHDVNNPRVAMAAGREALKKIDEAIANRESFSQETTLSSKQPIKALQTAKAAGYETKLVYVGLHDAETSSRRVSERVKNGGHDIPEDAIRRRYEKSMENLPVAMQAADHVLLFDNQNNFRSVGEIKERTIIHGTEVPDWADKAIKTYQVETTKADILNEVAQTIPLSKSERQDIEKSLDKPLRAAFDKGNVDIEQVKKDLAQGITLLKDELSQVSTKQTSPDKSQATKDKDNTRG